jgi:hypothetical protein
MLRLLIEVDPELGYTTARFLASRNKPEALQVLKELADAGNERAHAELLNLRQNSH